MKLLPIILGALIIFIDFATYGFKYNYASITQLGIITFIIGLLLIAYGIFRR